ncbi:Uncharacterised protein [Mycobacterium tuberculosis]|nr:Uncharacterised protein [Mycobacterium tuberculosis]
MGLAVVVVDDVGDDDSDVVGAAAAQRQFNEAVSALGNLGDLQGLEDSFIANRIGQPVRAQQVTITGAGFSHGQRRFDLMAGQRPHDQRALRVAVRLLRGDPAFVDQRLDKRVVLGDLRQLTVAQQVTARVTDMHQAEPVAREQDCGERGTHAFEIGLHLDLRCDSRVAGAHRGIQLGQQIATGLVVIEMGQCGNHQLGRHLAGHMPTHAVGQGQ